MSSTTRTMTLASEPAANTRPTITATALLLLLTSGAHADDYADLLGVFSDYRGWQAVTSSTALADSGPAAMRERRAGLAGLQKRLASLAEEARSWSVPRQVDYLTVRAELDQQDFILNVTRPWSRDPVFYVEPLMEVGFTALPASGDDLERLEAQLEAIPGRLDQARINLTEVAGDYADLAIRTLTLSDGVEDGFPYRANPPDGVIGWLRDLRERANNEQRALLPKIDTALTALERFHGWLVDNRGRMNAANGVGRQALDWFVQYGLLLPYTSAEMAVLSQRELDRMWAFYALEQHRNRDLPEIGLARSRDEYQQRIASTDKLVREWLAGEEFITIPDYVPDDWREIGYNVPWIERRTPPNFWEQVQFRDPVPDHLHAVIPGHRFDAMVSSRVDNPIRSLVNFGARWQGWAVYLEEGPLQAGVLESRPRARELIYLFGLWRAARSLGDIYNQWNEMTAEETAEYWQEVTPWLDPDVARKYAYLRPAPGHGLEYTIGNIQMFELLAEMKRRKRDDFVIGEFHDEFMSKGRIPIALIRYEMTGDDRDVKRLWKRPPLSTLGVDSVAADN